MPQPQTEKATTIVFRADAALAERLQREADSRTDGNLSVLLRVIIRKYFKLRENEVTERAKGA